MTGLDRRQVLRSAAAGTAAGLTGVGAAGAQGGAAEQTADVEATFTATVGSGFLVIDGDSEDDEDATVNLSLDTVEGDVELEGEIYENRTWQSDDITFPEVDPGQLIDPDDIGIVEEIEFDDDAELTVVVDTISGVYDPDVEDGPLVTGDIDMLIQADVSGVAIVDFFGGIEVPFSFDFIIDVNDGQDITLTTDQSQGLTGEAATLGCADPVVQVVNNEFTVPEAEGDVEECVEDIECINVNDELGLPSDIPVRNFIELELEIDWVDNQPFAPAPIVGESRPRDLDCDGNYDDIDGDGELTIFDVQELFDRRNDVQLEENAALFDFSGTGDDRVSVFDVQALYGRLLERRE